MPRVYPADMAHRPLDVNAAWRSIRPELGGPTVLKFRWHRRAAQKHAWQQAASSCLALGPLRSASRLSRPLAALATAGAKRTPLAEAFMLRPVLPSALVGQGSAADELAGILTDVGAPVICRCPATQLPQAIADGSIQAVVVDATRSLAELQQAASILSRYSEAVRPLLVAALSPRTLQRLPVDLPIDDFFLWPASPEEIAARLAAARYRRLGLSGKGTLRIGPVTIDITRHRVVASGREVHLTYREYELLRAFATSGGRVLSRRELLARVWGDDYIGGPRTVDIHVRRLRAKLPEIADRIQTVRGVGYRLALDEAE